MNSRNDPLSTIESFIQGNRENLATSVELTAEFKMQFDDQYDATCVAYFQSHPEMLNELRTLNSSLKATADTLAVGEPVVQPTLGFGDPKNRNAIPDSAQIGYLQAILKMMRTVGPGAGKRLQKIAYELNQQQPWVRVGSTGSDNTVEIIVHEGPIKKLDRILEKGDARGNRYETLRDYARASFVIGHINQLVPLLQRINDGDEFEIVRIKNRLDPSYDSVASGGHGARFSAEIYTRGCH
jgi:hypothetical protein